MSYSDLISKKTTEKEVDLVEIHKLLPEFKKKFFYGTIEPHMWGVQVWGEGKSDVEFVNKGKSGEKFTDSALLDHFSGKIFKGAHWDKASKEYIRHARASIGVYTEFQHGRAKVYCADLDTNENVAAVREKFLPVLEKHNIEYIWEYGGAFGQKAHLWIFCNTSNALLKKFMDVLWAESGLDAHNLKVERYPTHKPKNLIRLPGGTHLRAGKRMPCEYKGKLYKSAKRIIKAIIACKPIEESYMAKVVTESLNLGDLVSDPKNILSRFERSKIKHDNFTGTYRKKKVSSMCRCA